MDLSVIIPRKYYQMGNLYFEYVREDKYMYLYDFHEVKESSSRREEHENKRDYTQFLYKTPMLKVFKNIHEFNNEYYLILNLDNEDDINHEIYNFKSRMDRIYGKAQDEVKKNYKEIFPNLKGYVDQVTYETCVKRPYTGSRGQLMKILIEEGNEKIFQKLEKLVEGEHIQCTLWYKGLRKVSGGRMIEEYVLIDFVTEDEWMSEVTKKMIHPYGTKYEVEVIKEEIICEKMNEEFPKENIDLSNPSFDRSKKEVENEIIDTNNISLESLELSQQKEVEEEVRKDQEEDGIDIISIVEEKEKDKKEKKPRKSKSKESRKKREEWVNSKKGRYDSEEEKDGWSDQEEFQQLTQEEKEKFRKLYKHMKRKN
jgi:hypothetical protein